MKDTEETANFSDKFNKFFDILNVHHKYVNETWVSSGLF